MGPFLLPHLKLIAKQLIKILYQFSKVSINLIVKNFIS
mgnify:CR=1 FL=1